jgi:hypothetical protein
LWSADQARCSNSHRSRRRRKACSSRSSEVCRRRLQWRFDTCTITLHPHNFRPDQWRHNIKLVQWPTMNNMQSGALLVENAGAHVVQRSGITRGAVAGSEINRNKHAHFEAIGQVVNETGNGNGRTSIEKKIADKLGLSLSTNTISMSRQMQQARHTSHVTRHTSHVTRQTPHATGHTACTSCRTL